MVPTANRSTKKPHKMVHRRWRGVDFRPLLRKGGFVIIAGVNCISRFSKKKNDFANRVFANKKNFLVEKKSRPPFPLARRPPRALARMGAPIGKQLCSRVVHKVVFLKKTHEEVARCVVRCMRACVHGTPPHLSSPPRRNGAPLPCRDLVLDVQTVRRIVRDHLSGEGGPGPPGRGGGGGAVLACTRRRIAADDDRARIELDPG